jgi:NAD(P)-dependent dehydrogenase (short-subunit alcohol dehydrogenase family)
LKGVAFGMKHVLPHMIARGDGRIINTSSQLAHKPVANHSAYCASKAAVTALTASVAQEVAGQGITVNCVCPGMTDTAMLHVGGKAFVEAKLKACRSDAPAHQRKWLRPTCTSPPTLPPFSSARVYPRMVAT